MNYPNLIPDDNNTDLHLFVLDPLSVIIKLSIISNKPIGTKLRIDNNIIYLQEPGPFQAVCRYFFKSNKTDIQYLYNPIEIACQKYLSKPVIDEYPGLRDLFRCAQNGVTKLIETYKNCSIMRLCLNYYYTLIANYLDEKYNETLFRKDGMTSFYTTELIGTFNKLWTSDRIKIILNLTTYLNNNEYADSDVKSLENIMDNIDMLTQSVF